MYPDHAAIDADDPGFDERYRAISARDPRFDGQFISGVRSTGIYCRPSCPALTPQRHNVTFYRTAAAAHASGLRACKRCLPDAVPGSPDWNARDDLAARAMRLITDGVVERDGVPGLARRLGYTERHVTRVLVQELGASPLAIARATRAQTARLLLTATALPLTEVAFAAGFASVRQFNDTMRSVYERTPGELRRLSPGVAPETTGAAAGSATVGDTPTPITLRLPTRKPFDGRGLMRFFADHAITGIETGDEQSFSRVLRLPGGTATVHLELDGDSGITCTARLAELTDLAPLVARMRRLFDLDADSVAIDTALAADPVLAVSVARHPGVRLPGSVDAEETLFRTLFGQQPSVAAARTVLGRIAAELSGQAGLFPTAADIAERGRGVLRGPARRVASILGVAEALADGRLALDVGMPVTELTARLTTMPGIGPWTAGYVAMRVLGAPDVLLAGDLIMRASAADRGLPSTERALAEHGTAWAPWRSYTGLHLWRLADR